MVKYPQSHLLWNHLFSWALDSSVETKFALWSCSPSGNSLREISYTFSWNPTVFTEIPLKSFCFHENLIHLFEEWIAPQCSPGLRSVYCGMPLVENLMSSRNCFGQGNDYLHIKQQTVLRHNSNISVCAKRYSKGLLSIIG